MRRFACGNLTGAVTLGVIAVAGCAAFDAFAPSGPRDVTLTYVGDTVLIVGQPRPLSVTVLARGVPLPGQRLLAESTNPSVLTLNTTGDSLIPVSVGKDTLVIRLAHSSAAGTDMPTTTVPLRVTGGPPPGPP